MRRRSRRRAAPCRERRRVFVGLRERAQSLRDENAALAGNARAAWLSSVSLGTRLEQTRAGSSDCRHERSRSPSERAEADESLRLARRTLAVSQQRLADRVRMLYQQDDTDSMAVLVGARPLDEAITGLEHIPDRRLDTT